MDRKQDTEERIFRSALAVFQQHGYEGARMQMIADRAGINKSMLHYYYRSKEKLFDAVFRVSTTRLLPEVIRNLKTDLPIHEKIEAFIYGYIDMIVANPHLPAFFIHELRRNPELVKQFAAEQARGVLSLLSKQIQQAAEKGEIKPVCPKHLFANTMALCVFPFIAQPMLQTVFDYDERAYATFLIERKKAVTQFIFNAIAP